MCLIAYSGLSSQQGSHTPGRVSDSSFSLPSSLLFQDIPQAQGRERDDTALNSESITRPIYQLGSLYTINKHITALGAAAPRGAVATSSLTIAARRERRRTAHRSRGLCLLRLDLFGLSPRPTHTLHAGTRPLFRVTAPRW